MVRTAMFSGICAAALLVAGGAANAQVRLPGTEGNHVPGIASQTEGKASLLFRVTLDNGWAFKCGTPKGVHAPMSELSNVQFKARQFNKVNVYFQTEDEREGASAEYVRGDIFTRRPERTNEAGWGGIIAVPSGSTSHLHFQLAGIPYHCGPAGSPHNEVTTRGERPSGWAKLWDVQVVPVDPY